jgi:hypothetical protein
MYRAATRYATTISALVPGRKARTAPLATAKGAYPYLCCLASYSTTADAGSEWSSLPGACRGGVSPLCHTPVLSVLACVIDDAGDVPGRHEPVRPIVGCHQIGAPARDERGGLGPQTTRTSPSWPCATQKVFGWTVRAVRTSTSAIFT